MCSFSHNCLSHLERREGETRGSAVAVNWREIDFEWESESPHFQYPRAREVRDKEVAFTTPWDHFNGPEIIHLQ